MRERPKWFPMKPRNKRLPRETYEQPGIVWFFTIRAYLFQTPFVHADINRMVIDTLRETRETYRCGYCNLGPLRAAVVNRTLGIPQYPTRG